MARVPEKPWTPEPDVAYMPVPRCDSCAWWQRHTTSGPLGDCALFECRNYEQVEDECRLLDVSRTHSGEATIITSERFGCVQWKASA